MAAAMHHDDVESWHDRDHEVHDDDSKRPLLVRRSILDDDGSGMSPVQRAINQTYRSMAHLAKLLPTGTVLAFQLLSPIVTDQAHCIQPNRAMKWALMALCVLSCFVLNFRDEKVRRAVRVHHVRGPWVIDGGAPLDPQAAAGYRIRFLDFVHAVVSAMIFATVALFDQNVVSCFYPVPSEDTRQVLTALSIAVGVVGSILFVRFLTTRHSIGFPLSPH